MAVAEWRNSLAPRVRRCTGTLSRRAFLFVRLLHMPRFRSQVELQCSVDY
jgi:hypothetical protein